MSRDREYLLDILEAARLAVSYVGNKSVIDFANDIQCQDAVIRRIEIIGEAANRVSPAGQQALAQLDWKGMVGMRNILIHQYQNINLRRVWDTVQLSLPPLITTLEQYLYTDK